MAEPTIETRLQRRFVVFTLDSGFVAELAQVAPEPWVGQAVTDLDELGEWNDVLLYRFILMDLDEEAAFDPLEIMRTLRMEYQINVPVFCFGGDEELQNDMRLARADRFFSRREMLRMLPEFCERYAWGE